VNSWKAVMPSGGFGNERSMSIAFKSSA